MDIKKILTFVTYAIVLIILLYLLEWKGLIGLLIFLLAMIVYRLWKQRESIKLAMKQMEGTMFGKPLDKDLWEKGEMKNTKVIPMWKGKPIWRRK